MKNKKDNLQRLRMQTEQINNTGYTPQINSKSKEIVNRKKNFEEDANVNNPGERLYKEGIVF